MYPCCPVCWDGSSEIGSDQTSGRPSISKKAVVGRRVAPTTTSRGGWTLKSDEGTYDQGLINIVSMSKVALPGTLEPKYHSVSI